MLKKLCHPSSFLWRNCRLTVSVFKVHWVRDSDITIELNVAKAGSRALNQRWECSTGTISHVPWEMLWVESGRLNAKSFVVHKAIPKPGEEALSRSAVQLLVEASFYTLQQYLLEAQPEVSLHECGRLFLSPFQWAHPGWSRWSVVEAEVKSWQAARSIH